MNDPIKFLWRPDFGHSIGTYFCMSKIITRKQISIMTEEALHSLADAIGRMNMSKVPPPVPCAGSDIEDFFEKFERFAESHYGRNLIIWSQVLPQYLIGEPRDIVEARGIEATYASTKALLAGMFGIGNAATGNAYSKFFAAERRPTETLRCYAIRLETLAQKIDASDGGRVVLVKSKFVSSLTSDVARKVKVQLSHLDSAPLSTVVKVATTMESAANAVKESVYLQEEVNAVGRFSKESITVGESSSASRQNNMENIQCFNCRGWGHISRDCTNRNRESFKCFKCGKSGHFARDCRESDYQGRASRSVGFEKCLFCGGEHLMQNCQGFRDMCMSCSFCGSTDHKSFRCVRNPANKSGN